MNTVDELIRLHAKQLKIPSFLQNIMKYSGRQIPLPDSRISFWNL